MTIGTSDGPGRNLRPALMASLAFNILIVGAVAAALLLPFLHGGKRHHPPPPTGLAGFAETLPSDRAAFVRGKVDSQKEAFEAIFKEERESRQAARARMALVADTAAELTPDERKQLRDYFQRHRGRKPHSQAPPDPAPDK